MWNTREHLEAYMAVPCMGAVLSHTLNVRLFAEQLTYIVNHAEDRVIVESWSRSCPCSRSWRRPSRPSSTTSSSGMRTPARCPTGYSFEDLLAEQSEGFDYPELDERQAAGLCYTSGTTGNPKGVLYSHRSKLLHALGQCIAAQWACAPTIA